MKIHTLLLGPMLNCTYIVENAGEAVLIDPSWNMNEIYGFLDKNSLKPVAVFFTHAHQDHMTGADALLRKYNLTGYLEEKDEPFCTLPKDLLTLYKAPKIFKIAGLTIEVLLTPGHTRGSVCLRIGNALFTGDTLFINSVGRTDLPGANPENLVKSLIMLAALPQNTVIYTGHSYGTDSGYKSTIAQELTSNPYLKMAKSNPKVLEDML